MRASWNDRQRALAPAAALQSAARRSFRMFATISGVIGLILVATHGLTVPDRPLPLIVGTLVSLICIISPRLVDIENARHSLMFAGALFIPLAILGWDAGTLASAATIFQLSFIIAVTLTLGPRTGAVFAFLLICQFTAIYWQFHGPGANGVPAAAPDWPTFVMGLCTIGILSVTGVGAYRREIHAIMSAVEAVRAEAEAANRAKSSFLASMSHELRTPMNGVLGMAEMLSTSALSKEQQLYTDTIYRSGTALLDIVNDILDLSKIEAGKLTLENAPFVPKVLAEEVAALLGPGASAKSLDFRASISSAASRTVLGDAVRFRQVLTNLVGNALKFTERGRVSIDLDMRLHDGGAELRLVVADTGVGIAADKLDTIFNAYDQATASTTRQFGGTGLGLAITRELVEAMGGTISVTSQLGKGTRFVVTLRYPLAEAERDGGAPHEVEPRSLPTLQGGERIRVLVAEDNDVNRLVVKAMLPSDQFDLVLAYDGEEAVGHAEASDFDVIFMDINMPKLDGTGATAKIRAREAAKQQVRTPIIALTAHALKGDRETFMASGMDDHLTKPVTREKLTAMIAKWAGERPAHDVTKPGAPLALVSTDRAAG